jgi:beta-lactamase superfamily II metal-dependent hydrolase
MTTMKTTVGVRMYNVGFGDAFVVTVRRGRQTWRMLVDCGVHSHGAARPLSESVRAIIDDLRAADPGAPPHLDVVVATHHHADHIAGFAQDAWQDVTVDEVWLSFVEDEQDPDAKAVREAQAAVANQLVGLLAQRTHGLDPGAWPTALTTANWFALNSSPNATALDRLHGRNGVGFATTPKVSFLPSKDPADRSIPIPVKDVVVHVLGPPRDPDFLKRMDPPAKAAWLALGKDEHPAVHRDLPLFGTPYLVTGDIRAEYPELAAAHQSLRNLDEVDDAGVLAAAALLERCVNNTSVFFVLDVAGKHFVFPGDAQEGAWEHVFADPASKSLIADAVFYKISHHGSGNGTPRDYIESVLHDGAYAMLPWGLVKRWAATIPKDTLLDALGQHHHHVVRANQPAAEPGRVEVHDDLWSEVTFTI